MLLTSTGIAVLAFGRGAPQKGAVTFAVATGVTIAGYTFLNGLGARLGGTVLGYLALLEIGTGAGVVLFTVLRRRADPLKISKAFFVLAGFKKTESFDENTLVLFPEPNQSSGLAVIWRENITAVSLVSTIKTHFGHADKSIKLYVVYSLE